MADWLRYGPAVLFAGDLQDAETLRAKLTFLRQVNLAKITSLLPQLPATAAVADEMAILDNDGWLAWLPAAYGEFVAVAQIVPESFLHTVLQRPGAVVFEGAQGVLLDEWHGFHPYTTWSTTTLANAEQLLAEATYTGQVTRIGISRAYATRHGAGPFVSEDARLSAALPDAANHHGTWQQGFRVGWLDLLLLRYAVDVVGRLDYLALTCLDRLATVAPLQLCTAYQGPDGRLIERLLPAATPQDLAHQTALTAQLMACRPRLTEVPSGAALVAAVQDALQLPVGLRSYGPTAEDKHVLLV
jgi:adenylosuccinate synthase